MQPKHTTRPKSASHTPHRAHTHLQLQPLGTPKSEMRISSASRPARHKNYSFLRSAASTAMFAVVIFGIAALTNAFVFQSYYVEGTSMTPTLHNNDRLIIDKFGHSLAKLQGGNYIPNRGDIVIVDSTIKDKQGHMEQLIKRVVGLPGDRVVIEDGTITIYNKANPKGFNADKVLGLHLSPTFSASNIDTTLKENQVFIVGDNRVPGGSLDSRVFGPVTINNLEGKLWMRVYPFADASFF